MNRKFAVILIIVLLVNLATTVALCVRVFGVSQNETSGLVFATTTKYTLYVGTNDKDTYAPVMPLAEAKAKLNALCLKYVDGFTVVEAQGGWIDEKDQPTHEDTLVYSFVDVTENQILPLINEMLSTLNQSSILVETDVRSRMFYTGSK